MSPSSLQEARPARPAGPARTRPIPRRAAARPLRGLPALASALALAGASACSSAEAEERDPPAAPPAGSPPAWSSPAEIRLENLRTVPPTLSAMVDEGHPDFQEAGSLPRGYKRVPDDVLDVAFFKLEELGFARLSVALDGDEAPDPSRQIRRIVVRRGDEWRAFVVPRGPTEEQAEHLRAMAGAVLDLYNNVDSLRYAEEAEGLRYFEESRPRRDGGRR